MKLKHVELKRTSILIRRDILEMVWRAQASHVGSALSCVDILTALYFNVAQIDPIRPSNPNRDRIILSKGHGGVALLSTLARRGFFPVSELKNYLKDGTTLTGHTMIESAKGIEATTGSLGHGLSLGIGMSLAAKSDKKNYKVYVIISDGELDEGSVWEAILAAGNFRLNNLVVIVDYNKIQSFGTTKEVMDLEPLQSKWESFKWAVNVVNGHNFSQLLDCLTSIPFKKFRPNVIIAHTVKGKGVSFMENRLEWHYKSPDDQELKLALKELS